MSRSFKTDPATFDKTTKVVSRSSPNIRKKWAMLKVIKRRQQRSKEKVFNGRYYFKEPDMAGSDSGTLREEQS